MVYWTVKKSLAAISIIYTNAYYFDLTSQKIFYEEINESIAKLLHREIIDWIDWILIIGFCFLFSCSHVDFFWRFHILLILMISENDDGDDDYGFRKPTFENKF